MQTAPDDGRTMRADAERFLAEAQATIRSLQTKLAHAELTHGEALAAERYAREQAEAALRDLLAAREPAEQERAGAKATQGAETPTSRVETKHAASRKPKKPKPKATAGKAREPKPVKWWLPGYKTTAKAC